MKNFTRLTEVLAGLTILGIVVFFIVYVIINVSGKGHKTYTISANFQEIGGLSVGASVAVKGVVIGKVEKITINPYYEVQVFMSINKDLKLPKDSKAEIKSTSLFAEREVEITPGTSTELLSAHSIITNTVDYMYLEDKITSALFK